MYASNNIISTANDNALYVYVYLHLYICHCRKKYMVLASCSMAEVQITCGKVCTMNSMCMFHLYYINYNN